MAYKSLLFVCYAFWLSMFSFHHTMADDLDGFINIDEYDLEPRKESTVINERADSADGEDDERDDGSGSVMSDESGSGSGDGETTTDPGIVDVSVVSPTLTSTTKIDNEITESTSKSTEESENGDDENVHHGGVNTFRNDVATEDSTEESPNAEALGPGGKGEKDRKVKKLPRVLTTEVIAAVVVGAVCAVILIAFLVYRLRKRDEGSYALSDGGYKDTYKLQADTGKEAFV